MTMYDSSANSAVHPQNSNYAPTASGSWIPKKDHPMTTRNMLSSIPTWLLAACTAAVMPAVALGDNPHDHELSRSAVAKRTAGTPWGYIRDSLSALCDDIEHQANFMGDNTRLYRYDLRPGVTEQDVHNLLTSLVTQGSLVYGESNWSAHAANGQTGSLWVTDIGIGATQYHDQYAGQLLGISQAHTRSQGQGVVVAIIDSGIDLTHEAVQGPLAVWQWDFVQGDATPYEEGDGIDNDNDGVVDDGMGHGTYISSLIRLVAPQAKLMHLRVLDDEGQSTAFMVALAIDSAIAHGANIINVSASTEFNSAALAESVVRATQAGAIVVAAMGNAATQLPAILQYPAGLNQTYAVCATDHNDLKAGFSNWGEVADFSAPGASLMSSGGQHSPLTSILGAVPGEGYAHWSGTSLSTAMLTGAAALVRAQYPNIPNATVPPVDVASFVMGKLGATAIAIDSMNPGYSGMLGVGRVRVDAAVATGPGAPRVGDIDADGLISSDDLTMILAAWGVCPGDPCGADLDGNGVVNGLDLSALMGAWD